MKTCLGDYLQSSPVQKKLASMLSANVLKWFIYKAFCRMFPFEQQLFFTVFDKTQHINICKDRGMNRNQQQEKLLYFNFLTLCSFETSTWCANKRKGYSKKPRGKDQSQTSIQAGPYSQHMQKSSNRGQQINPWKQAGVSLEPGKKNIYSLTQNIRKVSGKGHAEVSDRQHPEVQRYVHLHGNRGGVSTNRATCVLWPALPPTDNITLEINAYCSTIYSS